jgi:glutamine cyclotransferase
MGEGMSRKAQLWLRLLGIPGFVLLLLVLPVISRRCGMGATITPPPFPGTATPTSSAAASLVPTQTPEPTATRAPTQTPTPTSTATRLTATATITVTSATVEDVPVDIYRVLETYPHDPQAWTQGLVYHEGVLYEGTGLRGRSSLRQVELETGEVLRLKPLPAHYFGEGIAILDGRIYQLTWQSNVGFIYELATFEQVGQFSYPTEGWGLTHDGAQLIMSDGTATLHFLDPTDLSKVGQVTAHDAAGPIIRLNELEYVRGEVWANVWTTDRIARIDPGDGSVVGWIDLGGLLSPEDVAGQVDVLNGIAYDAEGDRIFVTGKLWPKLFEIQLVPVE